MLLEKANTTQDELEELVDIIVSLGGSGMTFVEALRNLTQNTDFSSIITANTTSQKGGIFYILFLVLFI